MRLFQLLNRPATVLVVLGIIIAVNGFLFYEYRARTSGPDEAASGGSEATNAAESTSETSEVDYVRKVGDIQNGSVEASLDTNGKLPRYDGLTTDDIAQMKANYAALTDYASRAKGLDPPEKYEPQHEVFVRAVDELRDADGLAYQLIAEPASATQADFEAYDAHISRATAYLKQSNEMLGRDYKTTAAAQKISFG